MHKPYEDRINHKADFRVKYKFLSPDEGGRQSGTPFQGIRFDFSIDDERGNQQYMIRPEFEDEFGNVIIHDDECVPIKGTARMWIVDPKMRPIHYDKIKVGIKGHFREGPVYIAECEVIEILDLMKNPTKALF